MKKGAPPPPKPCPCGSAVAYDACCGPYHKGERPAPDPVALMRSRFSAFALGQAEYLVDTLAASHPDHDLPRADLLRSLRDTRGRQYKSLAILDDRRTGKTGEVLFAAGIREGARDMSFVELSDFEQERGAWKYASGVLIPLAELGRPVEGLTIDVFLDLAGSR